MHILTLLFAVNFFSELERVGWYNSNVKPFFSLSVSVFQMSFLWKFTFFTSLQHLHKDFDYSSAINITLFVSEVAASMQQENTVSSLSRFLTPSARRASFHSRRQLTLVSPFYEQLLMLKIKAVSKGSFFSSSAAEARRQLGPALSHIMHLQTQLKPHSVHPTFDKILIACA